MQVNFDGVKKQQANALADLAACNAAQFASPHPNDPKQEAGQKKAPLAALPIAVLMEDAVAHGEGALKYGRHNWRKGDVLASTYFSAALRHLFAWFEGEDIDPDSGLSHITKARASLGVLRDAQIQGRAIDDRPPASPAGHFDDVNRATVEMTHRVQAPPDNSD